ncbi:hypothetical protein [Microbacterium gorillae]|uniref:hypothetical protein n=1 Tax=Microbacterium gorillae TaxID=1231063 RepID=UPI00058B5DE8|nr:hypothetical protein [Microbacterium gorillae]
MSSDRSLSVSVPRTAVPLGITDPVESARAELKAALSAIEEKVNVPKQAKKATVKARLFARREPAVTAAAVLAAAAVVGGVVWAIARSLSTPR